MKFIRLLLLCVFFVPFSVRAADSSFMMAAQLLAAAKNAAGVHGKESDISADEIFRRHSEVVVEGIGKIRMCRESDLIGYFRDVHIIVYE